MLARISRRRTVTELKACFYFKGEIKKAYRNLPLIVPSTCPSEGQRATKAKALKTGERRRGGAGGQATRKSTQGREEWELLVQAGKLQRQR